MKIVQMLPTLAFGDAVGNDARAIKKILAEQGYTTEIYAQSFDKRLPKNSGKRIAKIPDLERDDILLYHACTGGPLNFKLPEFGGKKVLVYHNITPPKFFSYYSPSAEAVQEQAYRGMRFLSDKVDYCIADSEYNKSDLRKLGFTCPIDVCPILIPFDDYLQPPDEKIIRQKEQSSITDILFVGRVAPNKKQEDIIRAFYCYRKHYNPDSRLILIGSSRGFEKYEEDLRTYAGKLGLEDNVIFPGHISFSEILAYYRTADLFVCMSEHEGFCVPLLESMFFDLPILAYSSCAVPDTMGDGGLLLQQKDPWLAAAAMDRILKDQSLCDKISENQKKVLDSVSYENVKHRLLDCIQKAIAL